MEGVLDLAAEDRRARLRVTAGPAVTTSTPTDRAPTRDLDLLPAAIAALQDHMRPDLDLPRDDEVEEGRATMTMMMTVDVVPVLIASEIVVIRAAVAEDTASLRNKTAFR